MMTHMKVFSIEMTCKIFEISESSFYAWRKNPNRPNAAKRRRVLKFILEGRKDRTMKTHDTTVPALQMALKRRGSRKGLLQPPQKTFRDQLPHIPRIQTIINNFQHGRSRLPEPPVFVGKSISKPSRFELS